MSSEFEEPAALARDLVLEETPSHDLEWIKWAALSSMIMALFAATGALFASITANESLMERTKEILEVSYLENDRLRIDLLRTKHEILQALGQSPREADLEEIRRLEAAIKVLDKQAASEETKIQLSEYTHEIFSIGITLLSIAITLSGMSIIAGHRFPWFFGLGFGGLGCIFVGYGLCDLLLF